MSVGSLLPVAVAWRQKTSWLPLHECKKSRILTRVPRVHNKMLYYSLVGERLRESNQIFETAKHQGHYFRVLNTIYISVHNVHILNYGAKIQLFSERAND